MDELCKKHYIYLNTSETYKDVTESIIGDMLMGRVRKENNIIYVNLNKVTINLIKEWYKLNIIIHFLQFIEVCITLIKHKGLLFNRYHFQLV